MNPARCKRVFGVCLLVTLTAGAGLAQVKPASARTTLYFPQLADGGGDIEQWQTTFTFLNPNADPALVTLRFYLRDGSPWGLDFGQGAVTEVTVSIPAGGSRLYRTRLSSATVQTGWAVATANLPVVGTVAFRQFLARSPRVEVTAEPLWPTLSYVSLANPLLGVAIANPDAQVILTVTVTLRDADGNSAGQQVITLQPLNQVTFNLRDRFSAARGDFSGTLQIEASGQNRFIAWTLNGDAALISALPPGAYGFPLSQRDQLTEVHLSLWNAAQKVSRELQNIVNLGTVPPQLTVTSDYQGERINGAGASTALVMTLGLSELIGDSPSELAWMVGHEMGHVYQARSGRLRHNSNAEIDADVWGILLALRAGYDPYGAAGALAKLAMVTGAPGLMQQFEGLAVADVNRSLNTRLGLVYDGLSAVCRELPDACIRLRNTAHPDLPAAVPLTARPRAARQ